MNPQLEKRLLDLAGAWRSMSDSADPVSPEAVEAERRRNDAACMARAIAEKILRREPLDGDLSKLAETCNDLSGDDAALPTWQELTGAPILSGSPLLEQANFPVPYVAFPLFIRGTLTQIHGPPKGGKSTFSLFFSVAAACGSWPQDSPIYADQPARVLFVSWEDAPILLSRRIASYADGLGLGRIMPENLLVTYMPEFYLNVAKHITVLEKEIVERHLDVVIFDTLSHAHAVEENTATEIKPVMNAMRRLAVRTQSSLCYVHHAVKAKEGRSIGERGRGSTAISASADIIIDWGDHGQSDITPVSFTSKWGEKGTWEVEYVRLPNDAVRWDIRALEIKKNKTERKNAVLRAITDLLPHWQAGVPSTAVITLVADMGISKQTCHRYLAQLVDDKKVLLQTDGKRHLYLLPSDNQ